MKDIKEGSIVTLEGRKFFVLSVNHYNRASISGYYPIKEVVLRGFTDE